MDVHSGDTLETQRETAGDNRETKGYTVQVYRGGDGHSLGNDDADCFLDIPRIYLERKKYSLTQNGGRPTALDTHTAAAEPKPWA